MYIGNMVQHTYEKLSYRSKKIRKVNDNDMIIVENTHEAIISREDFDRVQKILKSRSRYNSIKEKKYLFTGLLKCKECGASLSISEKITKSNNSHYTQCNLYRKKGKYGVCTQHRLNYNWLEEDLLEIITKICNKFLQDYDYKEIIMKANEINNNNFNQLTSELKNIDDDLLKTNIVIDNLYKDKISSIISEEDFKRMYENYSTEVKTLKTRKVTCEEKIKSIESELSSIDYEGCRGAVKQFMSMKKPSRNIIGRIVKKVEISENKEVDIYFNFKELSYIEK
jgi:hypothetical protein